MTYRSYIGDPLNGGYSNEKYGFAQTLMMYDIAALQHLYGADFSTNSGDTVYTWSVTTGEMSVNGVGQGAPGGGADGSANRVFLTIWDGNGEDTYDFSNYTENALIDLAPGGWSLTSLLQRANLGEGAYANGNIYNAVQYQGDLRSLIENAKGGFGNDEISRNQAANLLSGNNGNDVLNGRGGLRPCMNAGSPAARGNASYQRFFATTSPPDGPPGPSNVAPLLDGENS